jgi:hypothetical protein
MVELGSSSSRSPPMPYITCSFSFPEATSWMK